MDGSPYPVKEKIVGVKNEVDEENGKKIKPSLQLELGDDFLVNDIWVHDRPISNEVESVKRDVLEEVKEALPKKPTE